MFAGVGFGMKAFDPIEPTMLINTWSGAGITGSSSVRNRPAVGETEFCKFKAEGDDGRWLPLQPRVPAAQATTSAGKASFMRISWPRAR
jgi:hypothetical protein